MDQLEVDGSAGISSSTEFFYLVLSSGTSIENLDVDYHYTGDLSEFGNGSNFQIDRTTPNNFKITNPTGTPLQQYEMKIDLTGFALDTIGGTTASKGLKGSGDVYYIANDPLVIDFNGDPLDDTNFTSVSNSIDINMDGTLDTVYMPTSNTGLLIYDKDGNNFLNYIDKPTKTITDEDGYDIVVTNQINLKDHIFSEFFKFGNKQGTSSLHSLSLLDDEDQNGNTDGIIKSDDENFGKILFGVMMEMGF